MQFQCDLLGCPVEVAGDPEMTALGAAALAGMAVGVWPTLDSIQARFRRGARYEHHVRGEAGSQQHQWRRALRRALSDGLTSL